MSYRCPVPPRAGPFIGIQFSAVFKNGDQAFEPEGLDPIDQYYETNIAGQLGKNCLIYFGKDPVKEWEFRLPQKGL